MVTDTCHSFPAWTHEWIDVLPRGNEQLNVGGRVKCGGQIPRGWETLHKRVTFTSKEPSRAIQKEIQEPVCDSWWINPLLLPNGFLQFAQSLNKEWNIDESSSQI